LIPWYQVGYTMIGDVVPAGKAFLFFSLFGVVGKTSAFVGPFITSAIITDMNGNTNGAFAFLLPSAILGFAILCFVDPKKAAMECRKYLEDEARMMYHMTDAEIRKVEDQII
jgi:MFS-type transporter involved in bile tolerance (Atg22 family)